MSGAQNLLPGALPQIHSFTDIVATNFPKSGVDAVTHRPERTIGAYIAAPLRSNPTGIESWEIQGFSVQVRMAALLSGPVQSWARFGDLWAGVLSPDRPIPSVDPLSAVWPSPEFVSDLSTFSKIWTGRDDHVNVIDTSNWTVEGAYSLVAENVALPFPVRVRAGSQLGFSLILTPSILDPALALIIKSCQYTLNYSISRK